ncbi:MAG TPA: undecaprenyl-diphosphatase UppP [Anaerolineales bacterium]
MTIAQAILLGIIQGLTEFIPVSSTAHLLIGQQLLGLPSSDLMFAFLVIIQLGTVASLIVFFWQDLWGIVRATIDLRHSTPNRNLGINLIVATIPAALIGYLLRHAVEDLFNAPVLEAAIRLFAAAILLAAAEYFGKRSRGLDSLTWLDALVIGLFQLIAVFPGASRSAATIGGGMLRGFDRPAAARFAFLMSVPILLGAGGYQALDVLDLPGLGDFIPAITVGFVTAAIFGWLSVRWLMSYLGRHSLYVFAGYCAVVGLVVFLVSRL